jgi:hypothetical protein
MLSLTACATTPEEEVSATKDFIEVNDLLEVAAIRSMGNFDLEPLNDYFEMVETTTGNFLLEYYTRCREFEPNRVRADVRKDPRTIYAKHDTFRGCRIKAFYEITLDQVEELRELGKAPGE